MTRCWRRACGRLWQQPVGSQDGRGWTAWSWRGKRRSGAPQPHHSSRYHRGPERLLFLFPSHFVARASAQEAATGELRVPPGEGEQTAERVKPHPTVEPDSTGSFDSVIKQARRSRRNVQATDPVTEDTPVLNRPYTVNAWLPPKLLFETLVGLNPTALIGFASSLAALARWMLIERLDYLGNPLPGRRRGHPLGFGLRPLVHIRKQ
jgi:hypothetical protein